MLISVDRLMLYGLHQVDYNDLGVWNRLVTGKINAEILCSGASRALVHFDSEIIGNELGLSCYNIGLDGSPLNFQLPMLKTYFKHNRPPKLLIQSLGIISIETGKHIFRAYQYIPYLNEEDLYENLIKYDSKFWRYRHLPIFGFATYGMQLRSDAMAGLFGISLRSERKLGFKAIDMKWTGDFDSFKESHPDGIEYPIEEEAIEDLRNIITLAQKYGTEVILVYSPEYYENQSLTLNHAEIVNLFRSVAEEYGLKFLDYSEDSISYHKEFFYNSQHLNASGAALFSKELAKDLKQLYEMRPF